MSDSGGCKKYTDTDNIALYEQIRYMKSGVLRYQDKNRSSKYQDGGLEIIPDHGIKDSNSCVLCLFLNSL